MSNLVERPVDTELLSAYLDGALTTEQQHDVEAQLAASAAWREELDSLRWSMDLVRQTPDVALPRSFEILVVAAPVGSASDSETQRPWWANTAWMYRLTRSAAAVSVALLVAVIGLDAWQTTRSATTATPASMIAFEAQAPTPASGAAEARKAPVEAPKAAAQPQAPAVQAIPAAPSPFPPGSSAPSGGGGGGAGAGAGSDASNPPSASAPVVRPAAATAAPPVAAAAVPFGLATAAPQAEARSAPLPTAQLAAVPRAVPTPSPMAGNPYRAAEIGLAVLAAVLGVSAIVLRALTRR